MTPPVGRPTENPKDIRLEIRLSEKHQEMLDCCAEVYRVSKAEAIRTGIEILCSMANRTKEKQEADEDRQAMVEQAEQERENVVWEEAYNEAFEEIYSEKYAEFIVDPDYTPSEAKAAAEDVAKDEAKEAAKEAVREFWNL